MKEVQKRFSFVILILFVFSFLLDCQNEKSSNKEDSLKNLALLTGSSTPLKEVTNADCTDPTPAFATLNQSGTGTCTTCHNPSNSNAGFDITSYAAVRNRIIVGDPKNSLLFIKINSGSMRIYNNNSINKAVFCWILKGANP